MKNSMLFILLICFHIGTLSSCEESEAVSSPCPDISGEWEWIKFVSGFGGPTITPDSLGITKTLIITDSLFSILINDTLETSSTYKCNPIQNSHFTLLSVKLGTGEIYVPAIHNDTLILSDVSGGDKDYYWRK
jgi:hypothetical protein